MDQHSLLSAYDITTLKARQQQIATDILNLEYEYEDEIDVAEKDYYLTINLLYAECGEQLPCIEVDPLLYEKYKVTCDKPNIKLTRKDILIKLGTCH